MQRSARDRLAVTSDEVWVADFKTDAPAARREYRRQLAIYRATAAAMFPGFKIRAYLIWIDSGIFEELAVSTLDDAYLDWASEGAQARSPS